MKKYKVIITMDIGVNIKSEFFFKKILAENIKGIFLTGYDKFYGNYDITTFSKKISTVRKAKNEKIE